MKKGFIILTSLLVSLTCFAQENFSMEENKVTQYEISMTQYDKDPEAEAVVIYEKGNYQFAFTDHEGLVLRMTTHTKIKILSQAGEKYATFEIPLYMEDSRSFDELKEVKAVTYNSEDNKLIKTEFVSRGNIFEEKINENWFLKKFTLPNVKAGSVIEVKYTISTPFFFNMREWNFQKKIPVVYSSLLYKAIPYYEYVYSATNIQKFDEQSSKESYKEVRAGSYTYKELEHNFALKNIPAFRDEEFISAAKDYMINLNFQLARIYYPRGGKKDYISTWEALSENLLKSSDFGKYINDARKEAKKILPTLGLEEKPERERIKIISDYVKHNFNWNGIYGKYTSQKTSNFLKTKRGNVADINLFLIGMLAENNINVTPLISSTRNHGKINKSYPFMHYFNYALAQVTLENGKIIFIDATEPMLPEGSVPGRCINTEALAINKTPKWAYINQKALSFLQKKLNINIKSEEDIEVKAEYAAIGQAAYNYRSKYLGKETDFIKYLNDNEEINIASGIEIKNYQELEKPFQFAFTFKSKAEVGNDKMFVNPLSNLFSKDNLFKQTNRTLPVDMNEVKSLRLNVNINIPEGYQIESIPENLNYSNDLMHISYNAAEADGIITVDASYSFKDYIYPAEKYAELKNSYAQMLSKFTEMIVFSKKTDSKPV